MIDRKFIVQISDFFLSIFFCFCFFYVMTAGAFLHTREQGNVFSIHPRFHIALFVMLVLLVTFVGLIRYRANRETFFLLQPFAFFKYISSLSPKIIISILFCAYFVTQFMTLSFMHMGMRTALWDVGFYDQMLWNTAHGKPLIVSVRGGLNLLGHHFEPIYLLLSPLYWFQDSIYVVFAFIALNGASNIVLVYLIAKEVLKLKNDAFLFALAVFFYQPLRNAVIFPIQSQVLADPFLLLGFLCVLKNKLFLSLTSFLLAVMCKENVILDILGIGFFVIFKDKKNLKGWLIVALAVICYWIIFRLIEPRFLWENDPWKKWTFFSHLKHPSVEGWKQLLSPNPFLFLFLIFGPLMFLPLICAGWPFLLGPSLLVRLLSNYGGLRLTTAHYTSGLNALLFIASIYGFNRLRNHLQNQSRMAGIREQRLAIARICFLVFILLFSGKPQLLHIENLMWDMSFLENQKIIKLLKGIPKTYSIKSTETFLAHLTHRPYIFSFTSALANSPYEEINRNPDLLIVDKFRMQNNEKPVLFDHLNRGYKSIIEGKYITVYASPDFDYDSILQFRARWDNIQKYQGIPYRKITRKWYKLFLIASFVMLILILIRHHLNRFRNQPHFS